MGLVPENAGDAVIYAARKLCPDFPGVIDFSLWEIGRERYVVGRPNFAACSAWEACATGLRT